MGTKSTSRQFFTKAAVLVILLATATSCQRSDGPEAPSTPVSPLTPQQHLATLDNREPVPLIPMMAHHQKENMRDHLVVVQEILQALSVGDFAAVEKSAARISFTPQAQQMCTHMGAGATGFTEMGINFHLTADSIIDAARAKDTDATLKALSDTLATCTTCHSRYRQEVVNETEWQELTQTDNPKGHQVGQ